MCVTALWGGTFVIVRDAVASYPVVPFLAVRFALASVVLAPGAVRSPRSLKYGLLPGLALAVGYLAQTEGLRYTSASKAGLLTGLFVVITPVLVFAFSRSRPPRVTVLAVPAAMLGTLLLAGAEGGGSAHENLGNALEVMTAIAFSIHIVLLARIPRRADAVSVALTQMAVASVLFGSYSAVTGGFPPIDGQVGLAILVTGILASAVAFWVQTAVQQRISPQRTALLLTFEPVFATAFGVALAGDRFNMVQALGAVLIVAALIAHEAAPVWQASRRSAAA